MILVMNENEARKIAQEQRGDETFDKEDKEDKELLFWINPKNSLMRTFQSK
jgi:hypothetical protein